jgi:hypothetical protein
MALKGRKRLIRVVSEQCLWARQLHHKQILGAERAACVLPKHRNFGQYLVMDMGTDMP